MTMIFLIATLVGVVLGIMVADAVID